MIQPHGNSYTPKGHKLGANQLEGNFLAIEANVLLNLNSNAVGTDGKPLRVDGQTLKNKDLVHWQFNTGPNGKIPLDADEKFELVSEATGGFDINAYFRADEMGRPESKPEPRPESKPESTKKEATL